MERAAHCSSYRTVQCKEREIEREIERERERERVGD
jgi:hypothetical protein